MSCDSMQVTLVMLGDTRVGKTCLLEKFLNGRCPLTHTETNPYGDHDINVGIDDTNTATKLKILDTPGDRKFQDRTKALCAQGECFLLVYDVNDRQSFVCVQEWANFLATQHRSVEVTLVGNKCIGLQQQAVPKSEGQTFASGLTRDLHVDVEFIECSAMIGRRISIGQLFTGLAQKIIHKARSSLTTHGQSNSTDVSGLDPFQRLILDKLDDMKTDLNVLKSAVLPMNPTIIHSPLRRLKIVAPPPAENGVLASTWTMVDLRDDMGFVHRCLLGARHCALKIFFCERFGFSKYPFFVELYEDILRRVPQRVGVLNPHRGNLSSQNVATANIKTENPADDVFYVEVKDTHVGSTEHVPMIPSLDLAEFADQYRQDHCLVGRSLILDVTSHHGVTYKIENLLTGTGLMKFLMFRCEPGNSGPVKNISIVTDPNRTFSAGVLFGLDNSFVDYGKEMGRRGLAAICPKKDVFTSCEVVPKSRLENYNNFTFDAVVGCVDNNGKKQTETAQVTMKLDDGGTNVVQMLYNNQQKLGVICESKTPICYSAAAGMACYPDVYAFG